MSQREIADVLGTTQPRVHRMLKATEGTDPDQISAEELFLRAFIDRTDCEILVEALSLRSYTFTEFAPEPSDGSVPGTWNEVRSAVINGLVNREEYEQVVASVKPASA
jgi:hypothetical protein